MKRFSHHLIALALILNLSGGSAFAATAAGMLHSNGGVSVNGSPATSVTTVFAGDRIETAPKAAANVTLNGSSLLLDENSSMVFNGQIMDFYCGGGTVQTTQGMTARYGHLDVKPANDAARYQVMQTGATLRISALDGDLTLTDGPRNFNLPAGKSMNMPYTGCVQQLAKAGPQDTVSSGNPAPNPPAPQPPQPTPDTSVGSGAVAVAPAIVISVALAGIIAVAQNPVSPHVP